MRLPTVTPSRAAPPTPARASIREDASPPEIVAWALERFGEQRLVTTTQFGMEGCALLDMIGRTGRTIEVVYLDTMFFFPETYALRDQLADRYPNLIIVNRGTTLTPEQQALLYGPELWKREPDQCCKIRKVDPMAPVMRDVDVWLTGIRRGQSDTRAATRVVEWDWKWQVLKVSPLANWSREQVWEYVQAHDVPYNPLHEQGYPTIGCTHCTKAVPGAKVTDYSRAGRWAGQSKTECGLHGDGI